MAKRRRSSGKHHKKDISEIKSKESKEVSPRKKSRKKVSGKKIPTQKIGYQILIVAVVAVLIVVVTTFFFYQPAPAPPNHSNGNNGDDIGTNIGQTAPNFELTDIYGNQFALEHYRGNIVILDFMAIRCPPCVQEMGELKEIHQNYYSKGVRIMSIDVEDSETVEQLIQFKIDYGGNWIFAAGGGSAGGIYEVRYIPTIYIINQQGVIAYKKVGLTDYDTLSLEIEKLL